MRYYEFHGHLALGKGTIEEKLEQLSEAGIVYSRDGGASRQQLISMLNELSAESILKLKEKALESGIEWKTPVCALYKEGLYGNFLGESFQNMSDFKEKVLEMKALGADYIKVMYSGIASFKNLGALTCEPLPEAEIQETIHICHEEGLKVMAHCNGALTIKQAIAAGVDSIEHGIFIDNEGLKMLAESTTVWVPTITAITNERIQQDHIKAVKKGMQLGIKILPGSDCGFSAVPLGVGTQKEYEHLADCGIDIKNFEYMSTAF